MNTLKKKVDLICHWIVEKDSVEKLALELEIRDILKEEHSEINIISVDDMLKTFLLELGIPPHIKGFKYIAYAIELIMNDPDNYSRRITKELYPAIANHFNTSTNRVERCIRTSISVACDNGLVMHHANLFGNAVNLRRGEPSNSAFIATCAMEFKRRLKDMG